MLSATIAEGVGLTFSPAKVIFTRIGVLLGVAKDVAESHGVLIDLFERIQSFLTRLDIYSGIPLTAEMITMLGNIMAEVLTILALSTNEMQERRIIQLSDQSNESRSILNREGQLPTFIIVDALDECPNSPGIPSAREKVLNLNGSRTSDISSHLPHVQDGQGDDIFDYVRFTVHSDRTMRRWKLEDKELVIDPLIEKANGMFRWVFCQLETLRRCFPPSIRRILDELPTTLDGTYKRTLLEIPEEKWKYAYHMFQCVAVSSRPLRVEEFAEVLAIQFDSATTPDLITGWRPENAEDAVLSACSSLIAVVKGEDSPVVQFSHFSVKEFLTSDRLATAQTKNLSRYHIALEPAHRILVQACLGTLLELDEHIDMERLKKYPLAFYAAEHWSEHARFGDSFIPGPLWQAVRYGHLDVAHLLLEHGVDGDNNVVQFLLDHGADVNGGDEKYGQPAAAGVRKWGH
ncbi:hypothetical protein BC827DRAFT_1271858 [Russula dissimulans]|nr:hypothetical protein BC827DRAFT_1271858 [Russula dissimulans]